MCDTPSTTTTTTLAPTTTTAASGRKKREIDIEGHYSNIYKRQVEEQETELQVERRSYGSVLRYQCGLARMFLDTELDELYEVNIHT